MAAAVEHALLLHKGDLRAGIVVGKGAALHLAVEHYGEYRPVEVVNQCPIFVAYLAPNGHFRHHLGSHVCGVIHGNVVDFRHHYLVLGLAQPQGGVAKQTDAHRHNVAAPGHAEGIANGVVGVHGEKHHVLVEALVVADGASGTDGGNHGGGCQHAHLCAAELVGQVVAAVRAGARHQQRQTVGVGEAVNVRCFYVSLCTYVAYGAVSDIVQQQAAVVHPLLHGVVQVGIVGTYGT